MRSITGFLILMIVILALGVSSLFYILSVTNNLSNNFKKLEIYINGEEWDQAYKIFKIIEKDWEKANSFFPILVDHANLHDLNITVTRISSLLKLKNKKELLPQISIAQKLSREIYHQEKFSFKNIF